MLAAMLRLRTLLPPLVLVLWAGLCVAALDPGEWLRSQGSRALRSVSAEEAEAQAASGARLIRVRAPDERPGRRPGSLGPDDPLPRDLDPGRVVVVVSEDRGHAFHFAARLARAGVRDVRVVDEGEGGALAASGEAKPGPGS
jgi:hypothetical protein